MKEQAKTIIWRLKDALNKYFKPQANVPYERLCFREMNQLPSETVEQFVT